MSQKEIWEKFKAERESHTSNIIESRKHKKIIVAGPGTGKTYLFQKVLERQKNKEKNLTLTFINALVDELSLSLFGLSNVHTLHGYALSILQDQGYEIFSKLPDVIQEDAEILGEPKGIECKSLFHNKRINEEHFDFYKKRKNYYGKYYGFADIIFKLVEHLKDKNNLKLIPKYEQVIIDEFQDFNELEVELIEILAENNKILIVGDDDQSLYKDIKNATPVHIRNKYRDGNYESFPLDFCSRSSRVIVESVNDFISNAKKQKLLQDRVDKKYKYFSCEEMDKLSDKYTHIIFQPVYSKFIGEYFKEEISNIAEKERKEFSVLIIVPNKLKRVRFPQITAALRIAGFRNINSSQSSDREPTFLEGITLILKEEDSNLGWRILAKQMEKEDKFKQIVITSEKEPGKKIIDLLTLESKDKILKAKETLKKILEKEEVSLENVRELLELMGKNILDIGIRNVKDLFYSQLSSSEARAVRDIPITITTIVGSKGLAADYVFIMDFSDKNYGSGNINDQHIYDFLVAMTRARKRLYLVSPDDKEAAFLNWIEADRIEKRRSFLKKVRK